ncbi:hypothetical protein HZC34_01005 [Candidatus Saganbacteria bacterium]|nr:hypothetical protein [Candidatus Saganbacteria bacterium]
MLNVGKFKKGSDGAYILDVDLTVKGPDGKSILEKKGLLPESEGREAVEKNGMAESPYGIFTPAKNSKPGKYQITLIVRDKVSGQSASKTAAFTLK